MRECGDRGGGCEGMSNVCIHGYHQSKSVRVCRVPTCHGTIRHVVETAVTNFMIAWIKRGNPNRDEITTVPCSPFGAIYIRGVDGTRTIGWLVFEVAGNIYSGYIYMRE